VAVSVLIVDDDAGFRRTAAELLRARGFQVAGEAADGTEAVAALQRLQPDAILVDVQLPDADGLDLVRQLVAVDDAPRILVTSSDTNAVGDEEARELGAVGFVPKTELAETDLAAYFSG
jgi:DNA-binding NarL/FixJ family response regulator